MSGFLLGFLGQSSIYHVDGASSLKVPYLDGLDDLQGPRMAECLRLSKKVPCCAKVPIAGQY